MEKIIIYATSILLLIAIIMVAVLFIIGFIMSIARQIKKSKENRLNSDKPAIMTPGSNLKLYEEHLNLVLQALNTPNSDNALLHKANKIRFAKVDARITQICRYIIDNPKISNAEVGRKFGLTGQRIGQIKQQLGLSKKNEIQKKINSHDSSNASLQTKKAESFLLQILKEKYFGRSDEFILYVWDNWDKVGEGKRSFRNVAKIVGRILPNKDSISYQYVHRVISRERKGKIDDATQTKINFYYYFKSSLR